MSTHVVESTADEYNRLVGVAQTFDELVQDGCRRGAICLAAGIVLALAYLVYRRRAAARVIPRADDSPR